MYGIYSMRTLYYRTQAITSRCKTFVLLFFGPKTTQNFIKSIYFERVCIPVDIHFKNIRDSVQKK